MKKFFFLSVLALARVTAGAQALQTSFSAASINDSLKKGADAVWRLDEIQLDITSPAHYIEKTHQVITILNSDAAHYLTKTLPYNKFSRINNVEVTVYDAAGLPVKKYRKKDFETRNGYDGFSLATDEQVMQLIAASPALPCTVEMQYEREVTGYVDLPHSYLSVVNEATERFRYVVAVPESLDIRYKTVNFAIKPTIESSVDKKVYTWETQNVPARTISSGGFEAAKYFPQVIIAPNEFEYDGYKGSFKTWSDFGSWNFALYQEKQPFSDERIREIRLMVDTVADVHQKIAVLYHYMQQNMRYVSIQLGIGGFKPFTSRFVDEAKYGDCKALSNYMHNLLSVAGIESFPALINAGPNKIPADPDFPNDVFNHVILCVPMPHDTVWLECTSNSNVAGFLGNFTENRNALLLTSHGGVLVRTPESRSENNKQLSRTDISLNEDGSADASARLYTTGDIYGLFNEIGKMEHDQQKEIFARYLDFKDFEDLQLISGRDSAQGADYYLHLSFNKLYDFSAGSKFFFPQHINRLCKENLNPQIERKTEYLFAFPYQKSDTTVFHLNKAYTVGDLPEMVEMKNQCASYTRSVKYEKSNNQVIVVSTFVLTQRVLPAADYEAAAKFFNRVNAREEEKIIFNKVGSKDAANSRQSVIDFYARR